MRGGLNRYRRDPAAFIDDLVRRSELGRPFCLADHQREILRLAFDFDRNGGLPYETVIYSCPKKSGKTTLNGAITLWWAFTQEPPNEVYLIANDLEQAQGRVFKAMVGILQHNPQLQKSAEIQSREIRLSNGTTITALASEYAGAAGSNHGLTSWDELWGYVSESSRRLWEELTPVPTRKNSIRFITTYAGWENESELLWELYRQGVDNAEHRDGQGERIHPDLPVYANREARLLCYWDHIPRMPWQTEAYYESQRRTLRPGSYARLHANAWTSAEETFITPELWDPCVDPDLRPLLGDRDRPEAAGRVLCVGVDASTKHDSSAVVAVYWDGDSVRLARHRIWQPSPGRPMDFENTIERFIIEELFEKFQSVEVLCDPFQLHRSITTLQGKGIQIREFSQTSANLTLMGETLFDLLRGRNLRTYPDGELRGHALNTVAVESPRGWRIAKEKASRKIDAIVALAMACVACTGKPQKRPARVLTRSLSERAERIYG